MSMHKRPNVSLPTKGNLINQKTTGPQKAIDTKVDPGSYVFNAQKFGYMSLDKFARPVMSGIIGLVFISTYIGNPIFNSYGINKFLEFALASLVADYIGNYLFDSLSLYKSQGIMKAEDLIVEPIFAGVFYALLQKYYMGQDGTFMMDVIVGGATDMVSGFATNLIRMSF